MVTYVDSEQSHFVPLVSSPVQAHQAEVSNEKRRMPIFSVSADDVLAWFNGLVSSLTLRLPDLPRGVIIVALAAVGWVAFITAIWVGGLLVPWLLAL